MKVQLYVDGKLVLDGNGKIEEVCEGQVELIVTDENNFSHIVQYSENE